MDIYKITAKFALHRNAALMVIGLIDILVMSFGPFGITSGEAVFFVFTSFILFRMGLKGNLNFIGYGVTERINAIAGSFGVDTACAWHPVDIVLGGCAPKSLIVSWGLAVAGCVGVPLVIKFYTPEMLPWALTYSAAHGTALLAEIYVWFAADRHRLWYMPEQYLREALEVFQLSKAALEGIIDLANQQDLLLRREEPPSESLSV